MTRLLAGRKLLSAPPRPTHTTTTAHHHPCHSPPHLPGIADAHAADGKELARVGEGGCFGELALLRSEARAATVMALSDASVLMLSRDVFTRLLGNLATLRNVWRFEVGLKL